MSVYLGETKIAGLGSGSGIDKVARAAIEEHATNADIHLTTEQLNDAVSEVKTYSDEKSAETLATAQSYADNKTSSAISDHNTDSAAHAGLFAAENHTHIVSEITDFPTSLPANGGNADTVGNVAVSSSNEVGLRKISAGTEDMTAGTSTLETGAIYLVYE